MKFTELLKLVGNEPLFGTGLLLAGNIEPADARRQLSRWVQTGQIYQLRRGLYALAPPYQQVKPHPFLIANQMVRGSYVSLQSALAYYALIPEYVPVTTSVTTQRPGAWATPLGNYDFRHLKIEQFYGYRLIEVFPGQCAFVATPEKALLDLAYFHPGADSSAYIHELRLQNLTQLSVDQLARLAEQTKSPKLLRFVHTIAALAQNETMEYETI